MSQRQAYTDQIIVKLRDPVADALPSSAANFQKAQADRAARVSTRLEGRARVRANYVRTLKRGSQVFKLPGHKSIDEIKGLMRHLEGDPDFEYAEPDYIARPTATPSDPYYIYQWHYFDALGGINLPAAWDRATGLANVTVAVIDTGIRPGHPDLAGWILPGYDFISDIPSANDGTGPDSDATDPGDWLTTAEAAAYCPGNFAQSSSWHGTHVAGTIAAATSNGIGVAGVAANARILPVRVLGKCGGYTSDIAEGIWWSAGYPSIYPGVPNNSNPARVINLSLGGYGLCGTTYQTAINDAVAAGAVVVVAAGNDADDAAYYSPASCNNVITVAATGRGGDLAGDYSNYGNVVEISAPGGSGADKVLSTVNAGTTAPTTESYGYMSGTSQATPHVSGVVALLLGANPLLTPAQVLTTLQSTARPFAPATSCAYFGDCGAGIVDANAALRVLIPDDTSPNAFSLTDQTDVALNTLIVSNGITVSGINVAAPISIAGCTSTQCEYNVNNAATWLTGAGTVSNGNTVKVRQKSSAAQSATTSLILSIGGVSDTFAVTTGTTGTLQFSSPTYSVAESGATVTLTVSRIGGSLGAASASYATANGSATAGQDYTAKTGTLSWVAGDSAAKTIVVAITNDTAVEADETFTVALGGAVGASLGAQTAATVSIVDNDSTIQFDAAGASVNESAGTVTLNVTRIGNTAGAASVKYATATGTALAAGDFATTSGTLNWGAGDSGAKTITVPIVNDTLVEAAETFSVTLSVPTGATLGATSKSTVTIVDNDSALQFSVSAITVHEAAGTVTLTVTRSGANMDAATVDYATANGSALAGSDYTATAGTLAWGAGDGTAKTITVPIAADAQVEPNEVFTVVLGNPVGANLGSAKTATVTIFNPGSLQFDAPTYSVMEGVASVNLTVNRLGGSSGAASVTYATANGSAAAGQDYTAKTGTLAWVDGDATAKTINVVIANDVLVEADETFAVNLNVATGAVLGATTQAVVTIQDNDSNVQFDAATASINEGGGVLTLNVTRTGTLTAAASVNYATAAGTALPSSDFISTNGTLTWAAGDGGTKSIAIPIVDNALVEGLEAFTVTLSAPIGATLGSANRSTISVVDNDSAIQFVAATAAANEVAGTVSLNVTRTAGAGASVDAASVDYLTANGTALAGSDYTASGGTVSWNAGELGTKTIAIPVTDDTLVEPAETFSVTLVNPVNASLGAMKTATATLTDNDSNLQIASATYSVSETGPVSTVSVTRIGSLATPASVQYATANGTATAGSDYTAASGTLSWAAGDGAAKTFVVPIANDTLVEGAETFSVTLANPAGATLGATSTATVTLNDNDSMLQFSAAGYVVSEIAGNVVLSVNRIGNPSQAVSVSYATANGTASSGFDYTARTGVLSWAANDATPKTIAIPVTNDLINEGPESFVVTLLNGVNASLGNPVLATVTIVDNEASPAGGIAFAQAKYTPAENGGSAVVSVTRTGDASGPATVNYATAPGVATTTDFSATSGVLSWAPGDATPRSVSIPILNDAVAEQVEAFTVTLSNPVGSTLGTQVQAVVAITDDDDTFPRGGVVPAGVTKPLAASGGWHVSAEQFQAGVYSLASDVIGDGEIAQMQVSGNFSAGSVAFSLKTASESGFDYLRFYVDGVKMGEWSGLQAAWTSVSYPLAAGVHTLTWSYEKDGDGANGADTAWIDSASLPAMAP